MLIYWRVSIKCLQLLQVPGKLRKLSVLGDGEDGEGLRVSASQACGWWTGASGESEIDSKMGWFHDQSVNPIAFNSQPEPIIADYSSTGPRFANGSWGTCCHTASIARCVGFSVNKSRIQGPFPHSDPPTFFTNVAKAVRCDSIDPGKNRFRFGMWGLLPIETQSLTVTSKIFPWRMQTLQAKSLVLREMCSKLTRGSRRQFLPLQRRSPTADLHRPSCGSATRRWTSMPTRRRCPAPTWRRLAPRRSRGDASGAWSGPRRSQGTSQGPPCCSGWRGGVATARGMAFKMWRWNFLPDLQVTDGKQSNIWSSKCTSSRTLK